VYISHIFIFHCLGRSKECVQIRGPLSHFVTRCFIWYRVVSPSPNPEPGGQSLIDCLRLFSQYLCSYGPHLEAVTKICNPKTSHSVMRLSQIM
jgi:hypothetical protein